VHEIPVLPSVVVLSVVAFAVSLWWLHRRRALTLPRAAVGAVLAGYVAGIIGNTLLPIRLGYDSGGVRWWEYLNLTPLAGTEPADVLMNVVVFLPLGVLLPLVARVGSAVRVVVWGFAVSLAMELAQWLGMVVAHGGHLPDVNDLLANTVGAPIGFGLFRLAVLLPVLGRLARAATWPARRPTRTDAAAASGQLT
jgi:glycopeptide antibiotics resistance protein